MPYRGSTHSCSNLTQTFNSRLILWSHAVNQQRDCISTTHYLALSFLLASRQVCPHYLDGDLRIIQVNIAILAHTRLTSMVLESLSQSHFQISPKPPYADGYLYRLNSSPVRSAVKRVTYPFLFHTFTSNSSMHYDATYCVLSQGTCRPELSGQSCSLTGSMCCTRLCKTAVSIVVTSIS